MLCFGSLNIDYVYKVDHFIKAGETLSADDLKIHAGGKGLNQATAASRAGASTYFAGKVGQGDDFLKKTLKLSGVNIDYIKETEKQSGHAIIQVDKNGQNCIMIYGGANRDMTDEYIDGVICRSQKDDFILLQNEINHIPYIIKKAKEYGLKVVFNPSPISCELKDYPLDHVDYFVLNEIEGEALTGKSEPKKIVFELLNKYKNAGIILTLGKNGALYADKNTLISHGIYDLPVVDSTAAGDTFTGYFFSVLSNTKEPEKALHYASIASSLCVSRAGASPSIPTMDEVLEFERMI